MTEYYPFGGTRIDQRAGSFGEQRRFTGHEFDTGTGLNYMDARYQAATLGRFSSEDPAFLNIGIDKSSQLMLQDPQLQNTGRTTGSVLSSASASSLSAATQAV